ncbi:hypothetical protein H072_10096 [Dactylellina haptotyla CBS 200.50]|uniref:Uncharacterized protein n=1 Tax=Dactylellina haptotyla (strain CBS 200.50) TaxID=1284197 RepID=S8A084_DACHA|nr:hypothetical protein H072_10096 [Dactylellina haptotyla CBS 200.50]
MQALLTIAKTILPVSILLKNPGNLRYATTRTMVHKPVVWFGEIPTWVHPTPQRTHKLPEIDGVTAVTYISTTNSQIDGEFLKKWKTDFETKDDVFNKEFLKTIVIEHTAGKNFKIGDEAQGILKAWGSQLVVSEAESSESLPSGPYFFTADAAHQAWRLYEDTNAAFVLSLTAKDGDQSTYNPLEVSGVFGPRLAIAVPSKLYFTPTAEKPLAGVRIAVKDIYDLKGTHTAASNRSFREYSGIRNNTAPAIARLIELGCIIVGKTKTTSFADKELPPCDWIEEFCPFNPRADGFQIPGGSSTGSGVAVAAYPWLDIGIGSDTSASIRAPAANNGIFGYRPSYGVLSLDNVVSFCIYYDTAAFVARNINQVSSFASQWYKLDKPKFKKPSKLLYVPKWLKNAKGESPAPEVDEIFENFVQKLEGYLGMKRTMVDVEERWEKADPSSKGISFEDYFRCTYEHVQGPFSYKYQSEWTKEYAKQHGKAPWLPPCVTNRWPYVHEITDDQFNEGLARSKVYEDWWDKDILEAQTGEAPAMMVDRWSWGTPQYRDTRRDPPNTGRNYGYHKSFSSTFGANPELVFPIGQYQFFSRVSQRKEWLPISATIIFPKGHDAMMLEFMREFLGNSSIGLKGEVLTGPTAFPVGEPDMIKPDWKL